MRRTTEEEEGRSRVSCRLVGTGEREPSANSIGSSLLFALPSTHFERFLSAFCCCSSRGSGQPQRDIARERRDTRPSKWCLCVLSLYACSAFSVGFIHGLVCRRKPFSVQSRDTVFILAGTVGAMSHELRHKTAVNVSISSQSSSKKSAMKIV